MRWPCGPALRRRKKGGVCGRVGGGCSSLECEEAPCDGDGVCRHIFLAGLMIDEILEESIDQPTRSSLLTCCSTLLTVIQQTIRIGILIVLEES